MTTGIVPPPLQRSSLSASRLANARSAEEEEERGVWTTLDMKQRHLSPPSLSIGRRRRCINSPLAYIRAVLLWGVVVILHCPVSGQVLEGVPAVCENEGERMTISLVANDPCISCFCQGRQIVCEKERCHSNQGCYMVLVDEKKGCCNVCKGCVYNNTTHRSGSHWSNPEDPCQMFHCQAGVVTASQQQCYMPCRSPQPPPEGHCCPSCKGCQLSGMDLRDGDEFVLEDDRCVRCKCHAGSLVCHKQACPVLTCPTSKMIHKPNTCCPECRGHREVYDWKRRCLLDSKLYAHGQKFKLDNCTTCTCNGSTSICHRESCSTLPCSPELQAVPAGECCPQCVRQEAVSMCVVRGKKYAEGETWKPDSCTNCVCLSGMPRCLVDQCSRNLKCPPGHKVEQPPGECCPQCVEEDAVCTVFGDPHYRTFDRKSFNFQGSCKYVLSEECANRSFSIRVRNDPRFARAFSWTKSVFVKVNGTKIVLLQRLKIKIDGQPVTLPHTVPGLLSLSQEAGGYTVLLKTSIGVSVVWDGISFVEVSVSPIFKGRLCGLCGNYDGNATDDFRTRKGRVMSNAVTFGRSWRIGGRRYCGRPETPASRRPPPQCRATWTKMMRGKRACGVLNTSPVFKACHSLVPHHTYFISCTLDMCQCPANESCHCPSLMAYAQECKRNGLTLDWREVNNCANSFCPKGAAFKACSTTCPNTCRSDNVTTSLTSSSTTSSSSSSALSTTATTVAPPCVEPQPCAPRCECAPGTVLHRHQCIKPDKCPSVT